MKQSVIDKKRERNKRKQLKYNLKSVNYFCLSKITENIDKHIKRYNKIIEDLKNSDNLDDCIQKIKLVKKIKDEFYFNLLIKFRKIYKVDFNQAVKYLYRDLNIYKEEYRINKYGSFEYEEIIKLKWETRKEKRILNHFLKDNKETKKKKRL